MVRGFGLHEHWTSPMRPDQQSVMASLDPFLDDFYAIAIHGHAMYHRYPAEFLIEHSKRASAACIYDHMVEEAERRFATRSDVRAIEIRGLRLWIVGDLAVMRAKKMDEDGRSRNYPTKQAKAFDRMEQLPGLPAIPVRLTMGYLLDETETAIKRVQVAQPDGKNIDWCAAILPPEEAASSARRWIDVTAQERMIV